MNEEQIDRQTVNESLPNLLDASQGHTSFNPVGGMVTLIAHSAGVEELEARAEGLLPSIASDGLQVEVHAVLPHSSSHVPTIDDLALSQKSLSGPTFAIQETVNVLESSTGNPIALVSNLTSVTANTTTEDIKDKAQALVLGRLRAVVFVYAAKLPIVGSYFIDTKRVGGSDVDTSATETTPLLGALHDPKAFATAQAEGLLRRLLSPLLSRLPDVDTLDNAESDNYGPLFKIFVECYVLAKDGGGWLL
jgi:hypothetical protein